MCQTPSGEAVRTMLGPSLTADTTVEKVQSVPSLRPQRVYEIILSDARRLHLVLPPRPPWRPLRSEQGMVVSEAGAVGWIKEALNKQDTVFSKTTRKNSPTSAPNADPATQLLTLLPSLLHQGQQTDIPKSPFAVYTSIQGTPVPLLSNPPTPSAQQALDRQLGALLRSLAQLTSPTGRFGPLAAVVGSSSSSAASSSSPSHSSAGGTAAAAAAVSLPMRLMKGGLAATGGAGTWSVAFHSMLEGALRDGEDMAVVMAYATIRRQFRRLGYLLDEVTVGRLVVVEGGDGGNVLVVEEVAVGVVGGGAKEEGRSIEEDKVAKGVDGDAEERGREGDEEKEGNQSKEVDTNNAESETQRPDIASQQHPQLRLTGLRDWSSCVFGDPLLATVFSDAQPEAQNQQQPSAAFLEGFNGKRAAPLSPHDDQPFPLDESLIEDTETAWVRLLLYQAYHAVVRIVREFYRPRPDSSARELEARRKLNETLARLAEVPDGAKRRHRRRPSGEMSPAKRLRGVEG